MSVAAEVRDPFRITGPAMLSFSTGRTSAEMLRRVMDAHGGALSRDMHVLFANTGKEREESLAFGDEVSRRWGVQITWLEYDGAPVDADEESDDAAMVRVRVVDFASASRKGEPFERLLNERRCLPGPALRFCTQVLKLRVMRVPEDQPDKRALVIDLGNNVERHGMPEDPREFSLDDDPIKVTVSVRLCKTCGAVRRAMDTVCWKCGTSYPPVPDVEIDNVGVVPLGDTGAPRPTNQPSTLYGPAHTPRLRRLTADQATDLDNWRRTAAVLGYKAGWVAHQFRKRYGAWPPWESNRA